MSPSRSASLARTQENKECADLVPLKSGNYELAWDRNGFNLLHLDRDPDIDPQHPWGWEVPWGGFGYLDMRTDVDDAALPFIAVPQAMREAA